MSVETSTRDIQVIVAAYRQARDKVLQNSLLSQDGKLSQLARIEADSAASGQAAATRLWGAVVEQQSPGIGNAQQLAQQAADSSVKEWQSPASAARPGAGGARMTERRYTMPGFELAANGEAWVAVAAADARLAQAREDAERAGIDAAWIEHNKSRMQTLLKASNGPDDFAQAYADAPTQLRYAIQDYAGEFLPHELGWDRLRRGLLADREQRVNTSAVQAAEQAGSDLVTILVDQAYPATKMLADELGRNNIYLSRVIGGIQINRVTVPNGGGWMVSIERKIGSMVRGLV